MKRRRPYRRDLRSGNLARFIPLSLTGKSIFSSPACCHGKCQRTVGVGPPTFADGPHDCHRRWAQRSPWPPVTAAPPSAAITGGPARSAVPRPRPDRDDDGPPTNRRRCVPRRPRTSRRRQGSQKSTWNKREISIQNGFGFLCPARCHRQVRRAAAAPGPAVRAAAGAPARGGRAAAARPRSSRPTRRLPGAWPARSAGTAAAPGRWHTPPSPELSPRRPGHGPSRGRTTPDRFPGRQPAATSRAAPLQARHAGLVAELQPCVDPPNHSRPRFTGDSLSRIGNTTYTAYLYDGRVKEGVRRMFMHVHRWISGGLASVRLPLRQSPDIVGHGCTV